MAELKSLTLNGTTYDSFATDTDGTLSVEGKAADAKAVCEALEEIKKSGGSSESGVFITVEDIDTICGASISMASEVLF